MARKTLPLICALLLLCLLLSSCGTGGVFGSLRHYLDKKDRETDYSSRYVDTYGRVYMDDIGCLPLVLTKMAEKLVDEVNLDIDKLNSSDVSAEKEQYRLIMDKGVTIYLSCACVNIDSVPEDQRGNVQAVNDCLHDFADRMEGPVFISDLWDYLYHTDSFCDTNYHMLTDAKRYNTKLWIRDLKARFETEGRD